MDAETAMRGAGQIRGRPKNCQTKSAVFDVPLVHKDAIPKLPSRKELKKLEAGRGAVTHDELNASGIYVDPAEYTSDDEEETAADRQERRARRWSREMLHTLVHCSNGNRDSLRGRMRKGPSKARWVPKRSEIWDAVAGE